jgi:hypothetical protein
VESLAPEDCEEATASAQDTLRLEGAEELDAWVDAGEDRAGDEVGPCSEEKETRRASGVDRVGDDRAGWKEGDGA